MMHMLVQVVTVNSGISTGVQVDVVEPYPTSPRWRQRGLSCADWRTLRQKSGRRHRPAPDVCALPKRVWRTSRKAEADRNTINGAGWSFASNAWRVAQLYGVGELYIAREYRELRATAPHESSFDADREHCLQLMAKNAYRMADMITSKQ